MPAWTMSSETSTEPTRLTSTSDQTAFQPWQLFTLAGLIGATIAVFVSQGESAPGVILVSLTVFAAAAVGLAALRTLLPFTRAGVPAAARVLDSRTRTTLEREKALALRSIKELEFDRAMGKVSDRDFAEMSARLRARAAGLMRQLDAGTSYRDQIEREVAGRVGAPRTSPAPEKSQAPAPSGVACGACGALNDTDARFCKACGERLEAAG
jgi:hypothetical protein